MRAKERNGPALDSKTQAQCVSQQPGRPEIPKPIRAGQIEASRFYELERSVDPRHFFLGAAQRPQH
jgi:hypothetical protein